MHSICLIQENLHAQGFKTRIVSVRHVRELQDEIDKKTQAGLFDEAFFQDQLTDYDFHIPEPFSESGSLLITAAPQPPSDSNSP